MRIFIFFASILFTITAAQAQIANGRPASDLLGQYDGLVNGDFVPSYTKGLSGDRPDNYGFNGSGSTTVDSAHHRLFVSDTANNRVLVFNLDAQDRPVDRFADFVLGQPGFGTNASGLTQSTLNSPNGMAYDPIDDRLFVSDPANSRVLVFDTASISNGENAVAVLGQNDFTSSSTGTTASTFNRPKSLAVDAAGDRLFVLDDNNSRVLVFDVASISNGENAVNVLGNADFTSVGTGQALQRFSGNIGGLAFDTAGNRLFVADAGYHRISVFDVASISNGESAVNLLGQLNLVGSSPGLTVSKLNEPTALQYDPAGGRLFVADSANLRIMVFDAASITNGENAVNVLGQPDFTTANAVTTQSSVPLQNLGSNALTYSATSATLYVAQSGVQRVSLFDVGTIANGENAVDLLGQFDGANPLIAGPNYTSSRANNAPNGIGFEDLLGVEVDSVHHRLFVVDVGAHRVLVYNLTANDQLVDHVPDFVLGQPDFASTAAADTAAGMDGPTFALYEPDTDRLFVSQYGAPRVSVYDVSTIVNGENAVNVLGQPDFTSSTTPGGASGLPFATGMAYDSARKYLFVADESSSRILVFDLNALTDGESAIHVLGQPDFTTYSQALTATGLVSPEDLIFDSETKRLYVADVGANRVLVYDTTVITDGEAAVNVLGQPDFTTNLGLTTQSGFVSPTGLAFDPNGKRLFVAGKDNHRITVFDVAAITDGENAMMVLGQTDFTTGTSARTRAGLFSVFDVDFNTASGTLYAADKGNVRLVTYQVSPVLSYSADTFTETTGGAIGNTLTVTLTDDTFVPTGAFTPGVHFLVGNLPAGLTLTITATSTTSATIALTGAATANMNADDVSNVIVNLRDAAFTNVSASTVVGSTKSNLRVDFSDGLAPTSTPTPSPTPTRTPSFTATVAPTSTAVPGITPTAGVTPTIVASPIPTAVPTAGPTVLPNEIRGHVESAGRPLPGALVYVPNLGAEVTDANGDFVLAGALPGTVYTVFVQKSGVFFPLGEIATSGGQFVSVAGNPVIFNPKSCIQKEISKSLSASAKRVKRLRDLGLGSAQRIGPATAIEQRVTAQFNSYLLSSTTLPEITLDCAGIEGCTSSNLEAVKMQLLGEVNNLRREGLLANQRLGKSGRRTEEKLQANAKSIRERYRLSKRAIEGLPSSSDDCL